MQERKTSRGVVRNDAPGAAVGGTYRHISRNSRTAYRARVVAETSLGNRAFVSDGYNAEKDVQESKPMIEALQWVEAIEKLTGTAVADTATLTTEIETYHVATIEVETITRRTDKVRRTSVNQIPGDVTRFTNKERETR